jgi:hypothetical protein
LGNLTSFCRASAFRMVASLPVLTLSTHRHRLCLGARSPRASVRVAIRRSPCSCRTRRSDRLEAHRHGATRG